MDDSLLDSFVDDGDSSDFAPAMPKAKAAKTTTKAKAAPKRTAGPAKPRGRPPKDPSAPKATKAKAAPKKKVVVESEDENSDVDMRDALSDHDDDSLLSTTPPKKKAAPGPKKSSGKPLADIANESFGLDEIDSPKPKPKASGNASSKYQMLTHLEHIMKRPDTYIGSVERTSDKMWVYNSGTDSMEFRDVSYVPGLYKIFDEILVNAADNKQNDPNMSEIRVTVDRESGEISVRNDGRGIPIEIHKVSISVADVALLRC
jgi:DNA topoisomerase II